MSKGSNRRPPAVPTKEFEENWSRTFKPHKFKIWLDDDRALPPELAAEGNWIIARTPPEFFALIEDGLENVEAISFDNDLGPWDTEGYDLLCHIETMVREKGEVCPQLLVHTQNPAARKKMYLCIRSLIQRERAPQEEKPITILGTTWKNNQEFEDSFAEHPEDL